MKTERSPQVFTGQVKFARSTCTRAAECKEWRSGSITFEQRENDWKLDIHLDAFAEYPALMPALTMIPVCEKTNNVGSNQIRYKLGCTVTEDGWRLQILDLVSPVTVFTCLYSDFGFILKAYMSTQKSEIIVLNFRPDNRAKDYKALGVLAQELKGRPITEDENTEPRVSPGKQNIGLKRTQLTGGAALTCRADEVTDSGDATAQACTSAEALRDHTNPTTTRKRKASYLDILNTQKEILMLQTETLKLKKENLKLEMQKNELLNKLLKKELDSRTSTEKLGTNN